VRLATAKSFAKAVRCRTTGLLFLCAMAFTQEEIDAANAAVLASLSGPKRVRVGDEDVEQRDAEDIIKGAVFIASQSTGGTGLHFKQLVPPGGGGT
jgi:hypothetical protein